MQFHEQKFSTVRNIGEFLFSSVHISQHAKDSYHGPMAMDVFEIRKNNLETLLAQRGKAAEIAGKVDSTPSYLSTIKNGTRRMGDEMARRIEEAEGLEHGWLDRIHPGVGMGLESLTSAEEISFSSMDDLAEKVGQLGADELHAFIAKALAVHKEKGGH